MRRFFEWLRARRHICANCYFYSPEMGCCWLKFCKRDGKDRCRLFKHMDEGKK